MNQMLRDKLFLVMLVLGLLTIVAAAGLVTMRNGSGQQKNPYVDMQGQGEYLAEEPAEQESVAGESNAQEAVPQNTNEKLAQNTEPELAEHQPQEFALEEPTNPDTVVSEDAYPPAREADSGLQAAQALVLDFNEASRMLWPIRGNIVLDYSMDSTIYFPTLDQYKCNPALIIQGEESDPVCAPANARVLESGSNEEIGNYLTLDFGNGYTAVCGQLKSVEAAVGEYLQQGQLIGYVAEPTKYYSIEGSNLYFELLHEGQAVDPLDYME